MKFYQLAHSTDIYECLLHYIWGTDWGAGNAAMNKTEKEPGSHKPYSLVKERWTIIKKEKDQNI